MRRKALFIKRRSLARSPLPFASLHSIFGLGRSLASPAQLPLQLLIMSDPILIEEMEGNESTSAKRKGERKKQAVIRMIPLHFMWAADRTCDCLLS